jgi:phenylpropionate dioxygenase-like ring-hydroxylating dioxygenase large terminal subunit
MNIPWTKRFENDRKYPRKHLPVIGAVAPSEPAREIAPRNASRHPLPPFPRSWYRLMHSRDLRRGEIKTVRYFDREWIVYRDQSGAAHVTDPHCPHLGAHLGVGGRVDGDRIVCPFHGWAYGGDGRCVAIPYCDKIPAKARLQTWPVRETRGLIFVWFDAAGGPPTFELPPDDDAEASRWRRHTTLQWTIQTHVQEIVENGVDFPHFKLLHRFLDVPAPSLAEADGARFTLAFETRRRLLGAVGTSRMRAEFHGLGLYVTPVTSGDVHIHTLMTPTPIDGERVEVKLDVFFERTLNPLKAPFVKRAVTRVIRDEFERDVRVWERKIYRAAPVLCAGDGPIPRLREWCRQFYAA